MSGIIGISPDMRSGVVGGPNGRIVNSGQFIYTSGDHSINNTPTTYEAAIDYSAITCSVGNTIHFGFSGSGSVARSANTNTYRYADFAILQSTSAVSEGATSSLGTFLSGVAIGRLLVAGSAVSAASIYGLEIQSSFVATAVTHYLGLGFSAVEPASANDVTVSLNCNSTRPICLYYFEIQGNVRGTVT